MKKALILFVLMLFVLSSYGQGKDYLVVFKPGKNKRYYYFIGQEIKVRPVRDFPMRSGYLYAVSDSFIYFSAVDSMHIGDIASVVIRDDARLLSKNMWWANLIASTGAIAVWQAAYQVNNGTWSPDIRSAPGIIAFATLTPILINRLAVLFRRTECQVIDGWRVGTVVIPSG